MDVIDLLRGPRLKIDRACSHIDEIVSRTSPLSREWYNLEVKCSQVSSPHGDVARYELVYSPKAQIDELIAIIVGDAVHNLRSALDHLGGGIIRTLHQTPNFKPYFPMHPNRKNLESDKIFLAFDEALPGLKDLILHEIRPENGPNEIFWTFNDLSNLDKHNLIIPNIAITNIIGSFQIGEMVFSNCGAGGDAAKTINMIVSNGIPIRFTKEFVTSVDTKFGPGDHRFENYPVISTLIKIKTVVEDAIDKIENLILNLKT